MTFTRLAFAAASTLALCLFGASARAGIEECANLRLEDVTSCELRGNVECSASCDDVGIYKRACATKLHRVCRQECTLDADATCTDSCTETCTADCDRGVNVICIHNCFSECAGSCEISCKSSPDPEQCRASCEATCDGECDIQCKPLVDGSCYTHCIECCGGSCKAQANMTCQTTCQYDSFEECEYELSADCEASCRGSGALFCDGEFVVAGPDIPACARALQARGIVEVDVSGSVDVGGGKTSASAGCQLSSSRAEHNLSALVALGAVAALGRQRARRRARAALERGVP